MKTDFSPSVNIVRDINRKTNYIPTSNTKRIFHQIINDYKTGIRSFNIIGSYGTGKSAFLLNFERNLTGKQNDFEPVNGQFGNVGRFEFLNIIGEYTSVIEYFGNMPEFRQYLDSKQPVLKAIDKYYHKKHKDTCLVFVIDEFGKFLEYAASHHPEKELYFIQQLAEYVNDEKKNILLITTLHQGFDSYARSLDTTQRQEWEKVKGRLKELTFNEPVELLLNLAAEHMKATAKTGKRKKDVKKIVNIINTSKTFPHRNDLTEKLAENLYPFDPLAGAVLTLALQKYGQNERSLFTFLNSYDRFGLQDYNMEQNPYYNLACVYDYLLHNYYSFLSTKYNPHYTQWAAIKRAVERIDGVSEKDSIHAAKIAKTIGLLNIFASENAVTDKEFLSAYAKSALGIPNPEEIIQNLESYKIIRHVIFKNKFILFEGTDLDFESAILDAATKIDAVRDIVSSLKKYFDFPYILAKAVTYRKGTPRFFEFRLSEIPYEIPPQAEVDGIINLIFSETADIEKVKTLSKKDPQAILYGIYQNTKQIRDLLFEIEKTEYVIKNNPDDRVAVEELKNLKAHQIEELNHHVLHQLYQKKSDVIWVFSGETAEFNHISDFNVFLSRICEDVYSETPVFRNELMNRQNLSGAISSARRNFMTALTECRTKEDLGFPKDKFPPEKTIYLSLLKDTGIHCYSKDGYRFAKPKEKSFLNLWRKCESFLKSAKSVKKNLQELVNVLSEKPLKLKQGFIDFWLPVFLFIKEEDFALYQDNIYIPDITQEILELTVKKPQKFQIKTFDVQGIKLDIFNRYRALLQQSEGELFTNTSFIETVKPFLTFYRSLPQYVKHTKQLSQETLRLRDIIATASEPEKTFFEDFPHALGYDHFDLKKADDETLKNYICQIKASIKELQTAFSILIDDIEKHFVKELGYLGIEFPEYRNKLKERYQSLREYLLPRHLAGFYQRLLSEFGDKQAWFESIVQAVLHKKLSEMKDEEKELVYDRLSHAIQELDNLCDISKLVADPEKEKVVKLELTTYAEGSQERLVRLPKQKENTELELEHDLESVLKKIKDRRVRIDLLIKLLQKELKDE